MKTLASSVGRIVYLLGYPFFAVYLHGTRRSRVLIVSKGRILLVQHTLGNGHWDLPGGGIHAGETPCEAGAREIAEELSIRLETDKLNEISEEETRFGFCRFTSVFISYITEQDCEPFTDKKEITDARYFSPEKISSLRMKKQTLTVVERCLSSL